MASIDYRTPKATWTQKANGQWRVQIRVKVPTGTDEQGRTVYKPKRVSKQFSPTESAKLTTDRKRTNAINKWIESLEQADADAEDARRKAEEEAKRKEQEKAQRKTEAERAAIEAAKPKNKPVGEYVIQFVNDLEASGSVERVTISGYRTIASRIAEAFPTTKLSDLTTEQVQEWENGLSTAGMAPATTLKYHRLLSEVYKRAVATRVVTWNPCDAVMTPKQKAPSPNALTAEGFARLARTLDALDATPVITAATIALYTGLRQGEVAGLRWREYDADAHTINVVEAIGKAKGGTYAKAPKTKQSKRKVPVSPMLSDMLARRRDHMARELQEAGITLTDEEFGKLYVVGRIDGSYCSPAHIGRSWKAISEAFELVGTQGRIVGFHDLRHSFATRAIAAGADVRSVAAVLGHSNVAITLNTYADADEHGKRRTTDLLAGVVKSFGELEPYAELANAE